MTNIFRLAIFKKYSLEILFGTSLSIILFDRFRWSERIGLGEILLGISLYISILLISFNFQNTRIRNIGDTWTLLLILFFFVCMLPITLINYFYFSIYGSALMGLAAYLICFSFLLTISFLNLNYNLIGLVTVFLIIFFSFLFMGDLDAWYGTTRLRYTAASDNPNRLAIYMLTSLVIISQASIQSVYKFLMLIIICALTYLTLSDASMLGIVAMIFSYIIFIAYRSKYLSPFLFLMAFLFITFVFLNFDDIYKFAIDLWYGASVGDYRFNLMLNGLSAWTRDPVSMIIGNGSGVFSGVSRPYEGWESHSTPIDLLSIGGIIGFSLFYIPIVFSIYQFQQHGENFAASALIGLVIFLTFIYAGRHPIVWFVVYISFMNSIKLYNNYKKSRIY